MDNQHRRATHGRRTRLIRLTSILFAFMACFLLVQAATANAGVIAKYRTRYKNKLNSYQIRMDQEREFYNAVKISCESHSSIIAMALADPDLQQNVPLLEMAALDARSLVQQAVAESRTAIYANIATFKATAVGWFKTRAERTRFKARLATMRSGFVQMFSADESLMNALYALGTNADVAGANNEIFGSALAKTTADDQFLKGLQQLRALQ